MHAGTSLSELRAANARLLTLLVQLRQDGGPGGCAGPEELAYLLSEVASTARLSRIFTAESLENAATARELSEYRQTLEELQRLLPAIQTKLLADRARLENERCHCSAASDWAEASRRTL